MILSTHLRIGGFLYKHVISKYADYSLREKLIFQLGNIYPDVDSYLSEIKHYKERSLLPMLQHEKRATDTNITPDERLHNLGVVCHYLTDFFCAYHAVEKYRRKSIFKHFVYEISLDIVLFFLLLSPKRLLKKLKLPELDNSYADSFVYGKNFDVRDLYLSLQKQYNRRKHGILNDIYFSLKITSLTVAVIMKDHAMCYPELTKPATDMI